MHIDGRATSDCLGQTISKSGQGDQSRDQDSVKKNDAWAYQNRHRNQDDENLSFKVAAPLSDNFVAIECVSGEYTLAWLANVPVPLYVTFELLAYSLGCGCQDHYKPCSWPMSR